MLDLCYVFRVCVCRQLSDAGVRGKLLRLRGENEKILTDEWVSVGVWLEIFMGFEVVMEV